jgi:hypothetical protein
MRFNVQIDAKLLFFLEENMKEHEYYGLIRDYNQMVRQKEFNIHSCNRSRMNKTKRALVGHLNKSINAVTKDLLAIEKRSAKTTGDSGGVMLVAQRDSLMAIKEKIEAEVSIASAEFEQTYCETKSSFVPAAVVAVMIAGFIWLMAYFPLF